MKFVFKCDGCGAKITGIHKQDAIDIAESRDWLVDFPTWEHLIKNELHALCPTCILSDAEQPTEAT